MKFKILTILFLISAIIAASLFGTLSSYTSSSNYEIAVEAKVQPTTDPTAEPTATPTITPTAEPTIEPTVAPTIMPTVEPTIEPTPEPSATPVAEPIPDQDNVDSNYVLPGIEVKKDTVIENEKDFVLITGTIIQKKTAALYFGSGHDSETYLLYFEPKTKIRFSDNTTATLSGFYAIKAGNGGVSIFDESLYETNGNQRTVKDDNADFSACTDRDAILLCEQKDIPLK